MAVKHIKEYYEKVCTQYIQMNEELKDFQKEVENGIVEPERIENLKKIIEPLKNNYMTLSWVMFLLNKPTRESKRGGYEKRMTKFTSKLDTSFNDQGIITQNEKVLDELGRL